MSELCAQGPLYNPVQKRILLINDLSAFGKCSLTVSLPVFSACDIEAIPLPTALLSTHTGGFPVPYILPLGEPMEQMLAHWQRIGLTFDAIYSGYLCGEEQIALVERIFDAFGTENTLRVVDPVMGDGGKLYHGFDLSYASRMRELCARADIITPNATEAALLCGQNPADMTDPRVQRQVFDALRDLCPTTVLTGAVREDGTVGYLFDNGERLVDDIRHAHYDRPLHGCGDVFASALTCALLKGKSTEQAVRLAADFVLDCIRATVDASPAHWYGLHFEASLGELARKLNR